MNHNQSCEALAARAAAPPAASAGPLPRRSILRWNVLIILWSIPLYALGLIVHELGHAGAAVLVGLQAYGISFPDLFPILESSADAFQDLVICIGGVALASLSAALVLPLCLRLRPSLVKLALVIYCAGAFIHSALYITSGYYCRFGDFGNWQEDFPHMRFLMPLLVLALPAVGFVLAGIYLPLQEAWLPAGTPLRRWKITALAIGGVCLFFSLAAGWARQTFFHPGLRSPYTLLIVSSFALLIFAGGILRLRDPRLALVPAGPRLRAWKALLLPLPLGLLLCFTWQTEWVFPHRPVGKWLASRYTDEVVAGDESRFSLCSDDQGNVLWLAGKDQPVRSLSPDGKRTQISIPGVSPLRIKAHRQLLYVLGEGPQGRCLATFDTLHRQVTILLAGIEDAGVFDAAPKGDLYFARGENELWLLPAGAKQAKRLWLAPRRISDVACGSSGTVYVCLSEKGFGEGGQIYALTAGSRRRQPIAENLSNPRALQVDGEENFYIGGLGWSSLCLIPATNRSERLILRGFGITPSLALAPGGSIYYWPVTGSETNHELRVLRPKPAEGPESL